MLRVPRDWSDLDPAWMSAALARRHPGVEVADLDVGPVARGTNSSARVGLTLARGDGPGSVFVKGPGRPLHRLALVALGALATEARLADAGVDLPLAHPVFYAGGLDHRRAASVVVAEDVVAGGSTPHDARTPLSLEAVESGLRGLAALHASWWTRPLPVPLASLRPWRLGTAQGVLSIGSLARGLRRADVAMGRPLGLPRGVGARALGRQFAASATIAGEGPRTVLHGDPHPGNTYRTPQGGTGFYDWQLARLGHWSHDVGYFVVGALETEERRRHERALLESYLGALSESGVPAPTFASAWARYRGTPAFGLATWLHTLSFGHLQPLEVCTATIRRFADAYVDLDTEHADVAGR